jgi:hypothetical protein
MANIGYVRRGKISADPDWKSAVVQFVYNDIKKRVVETKITLVI